MAASSPAEWPRGPVLGVVWILYAVLLLVTISFTPFAILLMVGPLMVTGWLSRGWVLPTAVGLAHGAAMAGLGWWLGVFENWPGGTTSLGLATAILMLLSWFTALAGRTISIVQTLRERTEALDIARHDIDTSAASIEAIYESAAMGLIVVNQKQKIVSWNPGAEEVFGRSADEMVGHDMSELAVEGDPDDCIGPLRYVLDTQREIPPFGGRMLARDGKTVNVEVRARPMELRQGEHGIIVTVLDKTQERTMEEQLLKHANMQDTLLRNLQDVLYSVEVPSMKALMISKTVTDLTGQEPEDFLNFRDFLDRVHPDDREALATRWRHARTGERSTLRWRILDGNDEYVWIEDRIAPARNDDGEVIRLEGIVRRIYEEVELERQAQRMMRWLDALEPMTGCGAWSVDLRSGEWQWSSGFHELLGTHEEEQEDLGTWMARLGSADAAKLEALVADPESARPLRIHVYRGDEVQECLVEPWVQRGNNGEAIWLYGLLRSRIGAEQPAPAPRPRGGLETAVGVPSEGTPSGGTVVVQKHKPGSPEAVDHFLRAALARSRRAMQAAEGVEPEVRAVVQEKVQETVTAQLAWAQQRRVPVATGKDAVYEPIMPEVQRFADKAVRQCVDRILAQEQQEAEQAAKEAAAAASKIQERIDIQVAEVQATSQQEIIHATQRAESEAARAAAAEAKRKALEVAMDEALEEARATREKAIREAEAAREQALQQAHKAEERAQQEAEEAEAARIALAEAEEARTTAVQEAEEARTRAEAEAEEARRVAQRESAKAERAAAALAKAEAARDAAIKEAEEARHEAMKEAEEARNRAEREAAEAKKATAALAAAQEAREKAAREAEAAKRKAESEAGEARAEAMRLAEEAQQRAEQKAQEAEAAAKARAQAQQASQEALTSAKQAQQQALQEAEAAKQRAEGLAQEAKEAAAARDAAEAGRQKALEDAERGRQEIMKEVEAAKRRAEEKAKEAEAAAKARAEAEEAMQKTLTQAEAARQAALEEAEAAKAQAIEDAEAAIQKARKEAQKARKEAEAEAERAEKAEAARKEAEEKAKAAMAAAQGDAEQALQEAQELREQARKEAEQARAAAKAEAAKAEQAEQARDRAIREAQEERDRAIHEAQKERDEAVAAAEAAKDRALRTAEAAREEAEERAAALEAELAIARGEMVEEPGEAQEAKDHVPRIDIPSAGPSRSLSPWNAADVEEKTADMDVVWDDEIGWIPKPKGEKAKDKAAELKAKKTSGTKRKSGPWALDD